MLLKGILSMPISESDRQDARSSTRPSLSGGAPLPWWLRTIIVLGALLIAMGAIIALVRPVMLVSPHDEIDGAVHIYAGYFASRNLGLAVMLLAAMTLRARSALNTLMLLTALIQVLDAGIDCFEGRWLIVPGVAVLGLMFFAGSTWLSGHPFWRVAAWKQVQ